MSRDVAVLRLYTVKYEAQAEVLNLTFNLQLQPSRLRAFNRRAFILHPF